MWIKPVINLIEYTSNKPGSDICRAKPKDKVKKKDKSRSTSFQFFFLLQEFHHRFNHWTLKSAPELACNSFFKKYEWNKFSSEICNINQWSKTINIWRCGSDWPHSDQAAKYLTSKYCKSEVQEDSILKKTQTVPEALMVDYTHLCTLKINSQHDLNTAGRETWFVTLHTQRMPLHVGDCPA